MHEVVVKNATRTWRERQREREGRENKNAVLSTRAGTVQYITAVAGWAESGGHLQDTAHVHKALLWKHAEKRSDSR